ncbi:DUF2147 domain-containing protein [Nitrobacter sp.]|uniref:DUF2147 domain-containing protein n=1 Tax=Nitrobacter sp. TaxID=29420 RepID=UPI003F64D4CD
MKKLAIAAALLLSASTAQAGQNYSFEIGGRTVRIHAPRGCDSPSCISISIPGLYDSGPRDFVDDASDARESDLRDTTRASAPAIPAQAATPAALPSATAAPAVPAVATPAPVQQTAAPAAAPAAAGAIIPTTQPNTTMPPAREPANTSLVATTAPIAEPVQAPPPLAAEPVGPLGEWLTEKKEGRVRIEECGTNLCGYSVDSRTGRNKEKVLINMKPAGSRWSGKIYDPKSGSTYSSTVAMKGKDSLRVQGCAFGGMFCGGQTWTRLN